MTDLTAFRAEVRAWLEANYPPELKTADTVLDEEAVWGGRKYQGATDPLSQWKDRMAAKGWTAPTWPREYGGGGLSAQEAAVLQSELNKGGYRLPLASFGVWMLGPVLLEYASEEQKRRFIPEIVRGDIRWCQGYSEPGAGSDLAGLQMRCEDKGDHWLVNGQKIWTSYADKADWIFALVRTDTSKKHEGVSFLLIDMTTPGVEPKPILLISGSSPFCETFFTDVKVPKDQLVGKLNGGWEIAKRLLQYERQNISGSMVSSARSGGGGMGQAAGELAEVAVEYVGLDATGRLADADLRARITANKMASQCFHFTQKRLAEEARSGGPSAATSIIKYAGATLGIERNELLVEAMGLHGLGWSGDAFTDREIQQTRAWLRSKGNSIEGGTSEINLNVVAKQVLGLRDHQ
ncbi:MAG: acyl-CoA dehydrogenase [Caulobacteraceae bacterium]|nr:MAG: acyl-CoA dehydrogenase [Caulobacteraceae bacterium]